MGPCKCIHTSDNQIIDQVIKSTMCSAESAMSGKFNQKAISYSYHEYDDPSKDVYFNGIKKNLFAIKEHFGQGWSMRLYIAWSKNNKLKKKCVE